MDINYILVWFVGIGCAGAVWSGLKARNRYGLGRALHAAIVLALTIIFYFTRPEIAGFLGLGLFVLLIILPGWGMEWMWQAARAGRSGLANILRLWLRLMHPFLDWQEIGWQLQVEKYVQTGRISQAQQLLQQKADGRTVEGVLAAMRLYHLNGDWRGANKWLDMHVNPDLYQQNPELACNKLRALGEVGALNEMVAFYANHQALLAQGKTCQGQALLMMMAFAGRLNDVSQLMRHLPPDLNHHIRTLWLATAHMAAGDAATGREMLLALPEVPDFFVRQSIKHRIQQGLAATGADLTPAAHEYLNRISGQFNREAAPTPGAMPYATPRPVITTILIALNVLVFILELSRGGSQNALTLYQLGALNPLAILAGEWWRLLTSMFLHAGIVHLFLNMYILYSVGRFMEYALGPLRFSLLYLLAGLGAGFILVVLAVVGLEDMNLLAVGASGAIMGLIGAEAALWIKVYRQSGEKRALERLRQLGIFFVIQTIFDLSTPQVSFPAHFGGLITGFLLGAVLQTGRKIPWLSPKIDRAELS